MTWDLCRIGAPPVTIADGGGSNPTSGLENQQSDSSCYDSVRCPRWSAPARYKRLNGKNA